jgi:hypothetical protein
MDEVRTMTVEEQKFIADAETFRRGFAAALRWMSTEMQKDAESDDPFSETYDDSYIGDMAAIRAARKLLK